MACREPLGGLADDKMTLSGYDQLLGKNAHGISHEHHFRVDQNASTATSGNPWTQFRIVAVAKSAKIAVPNLKKTDEYQPTDYRVHRDAG